MNARQQWLFSPDKPLSKRFGPAFFKGIPKCPGVYFMKDANDRVIYVGQSKNLHQRILSYKNAHPNHTPKRTRRLVNEIRSIDWEIHESAKAAILREDELLRHLKPRFNRANIYPEGYKYLRIKRHKNCLAIKEVKSPSKSQLTFGAFKGTHRMALSALARLLYRIDTKQAQWWQIPWHWNRQIRQLTIPIKQLIRPSQHPLTTDDVLSYFAGESRQLVEHLLDASVNLKNLEAFDQSWLTQDLEIIDNFFVTGPNRNHTLATMTRRSSPLIESNELNALLIKARALQHSKVTEEPNENQAT